MAKPIPKIDKTKTKGSADEQITYQPGKVASHEHISAISKLETTIRVFRDAAAGGDEDALHSLHIIGILAGDALRQLRERKPELVEEFARNQTGWPIVFTVFPQVNEKIIESLQKLGLGSASNTSYDPTKVFKKDIPVKQIAFALQLITEDLRRRGQFLAESIRLKNLEGTEPALSALQKISALQDLHKNDAVLKKVLRFLERNFDMIGSFDDAALVEFMMKSLQLPASTDDAWKQRKALASKMFDYLTGNRAEENSKLKKIVGERGEHSRGDASKIRDDIKKAVLQALRNQDQLET